MRTLVPSSEVAFDMAKELRNVLIWLYDGKDSIIPSKVLNPETTNILYIGPYTPFEKSPSEERYEEYRGVDSVVIHYLVAKHHEQVMDLAERLAAKLEVPVFVSRTKKTNPEPIYDRGKAPGVYYLEEPKPPLKNGSVFQIEYYRVADIRIIRTICVRVENPETIIGHYTMSFSTIKGFISLRTDGRGVLHG